jgi:polyhydroxyalkanoate synthase subunit PhaC
MKRRGSEQHTEPSAELSAAVERAGAAAQSMLADYAKLMPAAPKMDTLGITSSFQLLAMRLMSDPAQLWSLQLQVAQQGLAAWQRMLERSLGIERVPAEAQASDRRFRDPEWSANPVFAFIKATYQIYANALLKLALDADGLEEKTMHKVAFYTRQFVDAMAPTNFALTNPEVMRATLESGGANLIDGLRNFLEDIDPATGRLRTRMVDKSHFQLGENIAASPGAVVFQNELMQLIQYAPSTARVRRRPLLIVPPWINKFYVLDLQPRNSFIRWAVGQGHTVFVISWVNPDSSLREKDFADYMLAGPIAALDAIEKVSGERDANVIGYCIGGTLLGATLAYMQARGDHRVKSATFFTAMLDFAEPGDLGVFIDDAQIENIEQSMARTGFLDGKEMATTFNLLRANDLIWSFVVNNYLLGKHPAPFDLLYWNADSTRMPACMHSTYLRNMYQENRLCQPGGMSIAGVALDLRAIDIPVCFISALEDHIAPWKSTYAGARLLGGDVKFILGKAGHVAGIINPPGERAYGHMVGPPPRAGNADEWLAASSPVSGSWWLTWDEWVRAYADGEVDARQPGDGGLPVLEPAPGSYVKVGIA